MEEPVQILTLIVFWRCFSGFFFKKHVKKSSKKQIVSGKGGNDLKTKKHSALFINHSSEADNSHSESIKVGSIDNVCF